MERRVNVTTEALYDSPPPGELRCDAVWAMLEHVQYNYWRMLDWTLLWPSGTDRSPFHPLFRLHLSGLYPVGLTGPGRFRVFYRRGDMRIAAA